MNFEKQLKFENKKCYRKIPIEKLEIFFEIFGFFRLFQNCWKFKFFFNSKMSEEVEAVSSLIQDIPIRGGGV